MILQIDADQIIGRVVSHRPLHADRGEGSSGVVASIRRVHSVPVILRAINPAANW